jgi:hypothetical protein
LPGRPYGLAAGDEVILSAPFQVQGDRRVENGTRGTVVAVDRDRGRVTIGTEEREAREVHVDTRQFSDLNLGYTVHVYKAQGVTAERAEVLIGGWQTDREGAYVAPAGHRRRRGSTFRGRTSARQGWTSGRSSASGIGCVRVGRRRRASGGGRSGRGRTGRSGSGGKPNGSRSSVVDSGSSRRRWVTMGTAGNSKSFAVPA